MTTTFTYPEAIELRRIEMDLLPRLEEDRPWTEFFPIEETDCATVRWEQRENFQGLQQLRGVNGDPPVVARIGINSWQFAPGYYGEQVMLNEQELTTRRAEAKFEEVIPIDDLVAEAQLQLLQRELDRIETIVWNLVVYGIFSVSDFSGAVAHLDAYAIQLYTASVTWATSATATPLANYRAAQLLSRGHSVSFGSNAKSFMNRTQLNNLLSNTNTTDIAGRRVSGLLSVLNLGEINAILAGEDLPMIVPYDADYYNSSGVFTLFIPTGYTVIVGVRPNNSPVGSYMLTRNVNDPNGAGRYTKIVDSGAEKNEDPPRKIRVHRGHNGGPAIYFPSAIISMAC